MGYDIDQMNNGSSHKASKKLSSMFTFQKSMASNKEIPIQIRPSYPQRNQLMKEEKNLSKFSKVRREAFEYLQSIVVSCNVN